MTAPHTTKQPNELSASELSNEDLGTVLDAIHVKYGHDFRGYRRAFVKRRLRSVMLKAHISDAAELTHQITTNAGLRDLLVTEMLISVTEMFRDPSFFLTLRQRVVPILKTYPFVRIWVAGCASGEEAYSLAILLNEEGMEGSYRIYATDIDDAALQSARAGLVRAVDVRVNTRNYHDSGGTGEFSTYYTATHGGMSIRQGLCDQIYFSHHNLLSKAPFNSFQLVLCRNVMIYFGGALRDSVHELLYASLDSLGFLALGQRESVGFSPHSSDYQLFGDAHRIYRKMR